MTGVFDSGIGGLFLLKELSKAFPKESFIYLADQAHFPYGEKDPAFVRALVKKNINFLTLKGAKRVIVACNTATSVLEKSSTYFVPVIGVIGPALKKANQVSKNKKVGLLATKGTVSSQVFLKKAKKLNLNLQIYQKACPLLADFVEKGGWQISSCPVGAKGLRVAGEKDLHIAEGYLPLQRENTLKNLFQKYLDPLLKKEVDTIIMGCTHYLYLKLAIEKYIGEGKKASGPLEFLIRDLKRQSLFRAKDLSPKISLEKLGPEEEPFEENLFRGSKTGSESKKKPSPPPPLVNLFVTGKTGKFETKVHQICKNQFKINLKKVLIP